MTTPTGTIRGFPTSLDLKGRIVDFMERADEMLTHPMADYKPPMTIKVTTRESNGEVLGYELDHSLLGKEVLVYFATMERPILFTEDEPIYVPNLIDAIRQNHPTLAPRCNMVSKKFYKEWRNQMFIGLKSSTTPAPNPVEGWQLTNVWAAPTGTPFPQDDLFRRAGVEDHKFAKLYLNALVWHNDSDKTVGYREASELMQTHYRKCAEIRVFAGLHLVIKPIHQYFLDASTAGEDF